MSRRSSQKSTPADPEASGFLRKATHEQLAEAIERELRRGTWRDVLPSVRTLTKHFGSNLVTTFKATQLLLGRGMLISQGIKRRYRIAASMHPDNDQRGFNKVALIVAASKHLKSRPVAAARLQSDQNNFCLIDLGAHSLDGYKRELKAFFASRTPSHVILIGGDPEHLAFLDQLGIKVGVLHLDTMDWSPALAQLP
jgi:DNA-binding transcriptional regulator YhcF (GntR family)